MAYFPKPVEVIYTCPYCKGVFVQGNVSCCVAHAPGTCCHYGEKRIG